MLNTSTNFACFSRIIRSFCELKLIHKSAHWLKHEIIRYGVKLAITCSDNDGMRNCLTVKPSTVNVVSACASYEASGDQLNQYSQVLHERQMLLA